MEANNRFGIDRCKMNVVVKSVSTRSVRRAAMDCLACREHSFVELQRKLLVKCPNASEAEVRKTLEQLRDENLLSDERFTHSWVRYRQSRGYGYRHIRQDLQRRGIAQGLIDRYLLPEDERWELILDELVLKRSLSVVKIEAGGDFHRRLVRFLQGRGFRDSEINRALTGLVQA